MKKLFVLFVLLNTILYSSQIVDQIDFLKKTDKEILEKRIENIEKDYGLSFEILIFEEGNEPENNLNKLKKSVIINLEKLKETQKIKIRLDITKDIEMSSYEEDVKDLLDNVEVLANNENYLDMFYELTGNISDIISLIEIEKKELYKEKINKNFKSIIVLVILAIIFIILALYFFIISKERSHICKNCGVEMDLIDKVEENKSLIKIYNCKICGYTRKITSLRH